jgi:NADPH:quinone reductase
MRAVWYDRLGSARDVLKEGEIDVPDVGPGDVRVSVHVSGVNPSDTKRRSGKAVSSMVFPRIIPHMDGSGVIDKVGSGVSPSRLGERVWIYEAQFGRPFGTAAEFVVIPSGLAVRLPENVDFETGATLGVPAMTAHPCLFCDGPVKGQTILVSGGAGAVGNYSIQLAKWGGAVVIATVSSPEKGRIAEAAGADYVINYRDEDTVARVREITAGNGIDRIVDVAFGANLPTSVAIMKHGGVIATYASDLQPNPEVPFRILMNKGITVHFVHVYSMSTLAHQLAIKDICKCLEEQVLYPHVGRKLPLSETAAAHEIVESNNTIGKVLVEVR